MNLSKMRRITNKKGQGHIEMILSYTLFLGFVITMLVFFRPAVKSRGVSLSVVEDTITKNLTTNMYFFSAKVSGPNCFCFANPYPEHNENLIVENATGGRVKGWRSGSSICIEKNPSDFFYVYMSDEFKQESGTCGATLTPLNPETDVGLLRDITVISNASLWAFKSRFSQNYTELQKSLDLPYDFKFSVFDSFGNEELTLDKKIPLGRPVYSRDQAVEIIYEDKTTKQAIIKFYAW